eukprot:GEMP01098844.1.p2 GENE.GEMP01098844.1~~GEMP01098844.1.p2  ORF type:complete len:143 (-),score=27.76 GEMP01098844.1:102-530(-)
MFATRLLRGRLDVFDASLGTSMFSRARDMDEMSFLSGWTRFFRARAAGAVLSGDESGLLWKSDVIRGDADLRRRNKGGAGCGVWVCGIENSSRGDAGEGAECVCISNGAREKKMHYTVGVILADGREAEGRQMLGRVPNTFP